MLLSQTLPGFVKPSAAGEETRAADAVVDKLTLNGEVEPDNASFVLKGRLRPWSQATNEAKLIYSVRSQASVWLGSHTNREQIDLETQIHQGQLKEFVLAIRGQGQIEEVTGQGVRDWSIRHDAQGAAYLVIRPAQPESTTNALTARVVASGENPPGSFSPLILSAVAAAWQEGTVRIEADPGVRMTVSNASGLTLIEKSPAPATPEGTQVLLYQFSQPNPELSLVLAEADPDARRVSLEIAQLTGEVGENAVAFTLSGTATVKHPDGGRLVVLRGEAALTADPEGIEILQTNGVYVMVLPRAGSYPVKMQFAAKLSTQNGWKRLSFGTAPGVLRPVLLKNLPAGTQFLISGSAEPERTGTNYVTYLPPTGDLTLQWKEAKTEGEGKLFYAAQGVLQIAVGPGLLRQTHYLDYKIMQGELTRIAFQLQGEGEITRVSGESILSWIVEPGAKPPERRLVVQLNQPQKDHYTLTIQSQTPLGVFPVKATPLRLSPVDAIRYGGHLLVVNDGAVRLEVGDTRGLSQISREQFPQIKDLANLLPGQRTQGFAYRFSGADFALSIQADHIQPELSISEILLYQLSEADTRIDAELELEIREAPLREFVVLVPSDFAVAQLTAAQLSDYFLTPSTNAGLSNLRLVFGQPISGRQVVQLRLEKNQTFTGTNWTLPAIRPQQAKTVRGYVATTADTGLRLLAGRTEGLTEIAGAFFPRKIQGIQFAYRLRDNTWQATLGVERLARAVQVDAFHLFSISEGVAYGSSVFNYLVSGTPVASLVLDVPTEYSNIEFIGRDVRNWRKTDRGYEVFLHTPVFGAYTLLATFDRKFNPAGDTLSFVGPRPLDVQSEQGIAAVVSEYQFQIRSVNTSTNTTALEAAELPAEDRLLFDAPLLVAYRYLGRPLTLNLTLNTLLQGETVHQVVDRAALETHVSREGEVVTRARYYVKSQGYGHLRLALPAALRLWEASVNDAKVVPIADGQETLIPLPARASASALLRVDLMFAGKSADRSKVLLQTPSISTPVLLTEWKVTPDTGYAIRFRQGDLAPVSAGADASGLAWLWHLADRPAWSEPRRDALMGLAGLLLGTLALGWATRAKRPRWGMANVAGWAIGVVATLVAGYGLVLLAMEAVEHPLPAAGELVAQAPITDAGRSLQMQVQNLSLDSAKPVVVSSWLAWLCVVVWIGLAIRRRGFARSRLAQAAGWSLASWAILLWPMGVPWFLGLVFLFYLVHVLLPAWQRQSSLAPRPKPPTAAATALTTGVASLLVLAGALRGVDVCAAGAPDFPTGVTNVVRSLVQSVHVKEGSVQAQAHLHWQAVAGQTLGLLQAPAVLTLWKSTPDTLILREQLSKQAGYELVAKETGQYEIVFSYQIPLGSSATNGFKLPTPGALVNLLDLEIERGEVDIVAPEAISQQVTRIGKEGTKVALVLPPTSPVNLSWNPRSRDVRSEKPVFYVELTQLFIPAPGVIESVCQVQVRPAQGQLSALQFTLPPGFTITDVQAETVSGWRFDPDTRSLAVDFRSPQSRPFSLRLRAQLAAGTLPYEQNLGMIHAPGAAGQVSMAGIATGPEVQLDRVQDGGLSSINLEDFPTNLVTEAAAQISGLTLRRAFRATDPHARFQLAASAVEPDVRVQSQETLSLGEDRTVLAVQLKVNVNRAGIFKLSFALPPDLEVESVSGPALSHWTEFANGEQRVVTLHLRSRTEGDCAFSVTLGGAGIQQRKEWEAPRLLVREASKQSGQLVLVPETGLRLHAKLREGVTQLDPQKAGIQEKGVLAFRLLNANWRLGFDVETVEPWIELAVLEDVMVYEGSAKVAANLHYQIENAGVKVLQVRLPGQAENVHFTGDNLGDTVRSGTNQNGSASWEVKLQRRVLGPYALSLSYQLPAAGTQVTVSGIEGQNVNLQRGYLVVRSTGRLQLKVASLPAALQPTEWQAIPTALRQGLNSPEAKDTYRIMEPAFTLKLEAVRHEIARLLPARIQKTELTSVLSARGIMLTEVRLTMQPGDKRLLQVKLPPSGRFWHARVNQESAWPWLGTNEILLPLEKNSDASRAATVEFVYQSPIQAQSGKFNWRLVGPQFDLPLEDISWRIYVPEEWKIKDWRSSLQLVAGGVNLPAEQVTLDSYLSSETHEREANTRDAEDLLRMGNDWVQKGSPQQARRAFAAAWRLSQHDAAFNEDARVQLHNLKLQQALLGLNQGKSVLGQEAGDTAGRTGALIAPQSGQAPAYTQQQAQKIFEQNSPEENQALTRLAERLIRQQDAAMAKPETIRAALPKQGQLLTFTGSLQVEPWKDLQIQLATKEKPAATRWPHALVLLGVFVALLVLALSARRRVGF